MDNLAEQDWEAQELKQASQELSQAPQSDYDDILHKFRGFLAMSAEKKSKTTGELFREHIPESVFGMASDEVATDMGMSESELMGKLMAGLSPSSPIIKRITQRQPKIRKEPLGIDFELTAPISGYKRTIRALGLISFGDKIVLLGQRYEEEKIKKKVLGFFVTMPETLRYLSLAS